MKQPQIEGHVRLCHSNRQLHQEVARIVLGKIDQNPDVWSICIGLDDTIPGTFCQCETCKDFGPTLTDRVVRCASAIAEQVAQQRPDRRVSMFAYAHWRDPPIEVNLHSHVVVVYVGVYTYGYLLASDRAANHKLWDGWAQMIDGKMVWRPNIPESLGIPILYAHQWAEDMRRFAPKAWGADVDALRGSWAAAGLNQYMMARLLWKMDQNVDAIIDNYCETGFGPGRCDAKVFYSARTVHGRGGEAGSIAWIQPFLSVGTELLYRPAHHRARSTSGASRENRR